MIHTHTVTDRPDHIYYTYIQDKFVYIIGSLRVCQTGIPNNTNRLKVYYSISDTDASLLFTIRRNLTNLHALCTFCSIKKEYSRVLYITFPKYQLDHSFNNVVMPPSSYTYAQLLLLQHYIYQWNDILKCLQWQIMVWVYWVSKKVYYLYIMCVCVVYV